MRRLERAYGKDVVRAEYERLAQEPLKSRALSLLDLEVGPCYVHRWLADFARKCGEQRTDWRTKMKSSTQNTPSGSSVGAGQYIEHCLLAQSGSGAEARLQERNITLPPVPAPVANYVDFVRVGNLLFLAGNTAGADWKFKGKVGKDITVQEGYETARQVGLIMLAKVRAALGSLDRVKRIVKVLGMVNSPEGFGDQPRVVNGFSRSNGGSIRRACRQARTLSAVGMQALPSNSAVEVEMIVEVE